MLHDQQISRISRMPAHSTNRNIYLGLCAHFPVDDGDFTIYLQFITSDSFVSRAIRAVTWSEFSHVDILTVDGMTTKLLGAQADGVKLRPLNYCKMTKVALFGVKVTHEQYGKIHDFANAQIGKPYDYTALAGNLLHRDWQEDDSWFCSELVAAAFAHAGVPLLSEKANRVTPGMLLKSPRLIPY